MALPPSQKAETVLSAVSYIYIYIGEKNRDYTFIPISLFRDYSLIRGF